METCKAQDTRIVKPHVDSRHGLVQKIMKLMRFVELIIFLNMVFSGSCSLLITFDSSSDYDLMNILISSRTFLTSPWFVFVAGNSILLVLFLISQGCFSGEETRRTADFYDKYIEKCWRNHHQLCSDEQISFKAYHAKKTFRRSRSEGIISRALHENINSSHRFSYNTMSAKDMRGEDFRDMVEAFIARQQRFLKEEKECSS